MTACLDPETTRRGSAGGVAGILPPIPGPVLHHGVTRMQSDLRAVVEDKSRWGYRFRFGVFKIDEYDFTVIRSAMTG